MREAGPAGLLCLLGGPQEGEKHRAGVWLVEHLGVPGGRVGGAAEADDDGMT